MTLWPKEFDRPPNSEDWLLSDSKKTSKLDPGQEIIFSWEDITVVVPSKAKKTLFRKNNRVKPEDSDRTILSNVNGFVKPGELLAIMGASGSGKSTLLNALTFRNLTGIKVTGSRYANGVAISPDSLTSVSAYVQQEDMFIGSLTVEEHLIFQAKVRMDRDIPYKQRMERVQDVIKAYGLIDCKNTLIGIPGKLKGISGGEKKRLVFASEVLTNPPLMFCDEPTSGLDSYMAQNVVKALKDMAMEGRTIVTTIHQPSSQIFAFFDRVLLLAEGNVAFLGDTNDAMGFFEDLGYPCPTDFNPADHFIQVLAITPEERESCKDRIRMICSEFKKMSNGGQMVKNTIDRENYNARITPKLKQPKSPYKASWCQQFKALLWRSWLTVIQDPSLMKMSIIQSVVLSLFIGIIYLNQEYDQKGIINIKGALYLLVGETSVISNSALTAFCNELPLFLNEHFNGMYRSDVYFMSKQLAEYPMYIFPPIILTTIVYFMVGMNPLFGRFLITCTVVLLVSQFVMSLGYVLSCISKNAKMAMFLNSAIILPIMLFGGLFMSNESVPDWLIWLKYLSWFNYSNEILIINQWDGVTFDCPKPNSSDIMHGHCSSKPCIRDGDGVFDFFGFKKEDYYIDFLALSVLTIGLRVLAYLILLSRTYRKH